MASSEKEAHSFRIEKDSSGTVFFESLRLLSFDEAPDGTIPDQLTGDELNHLDTT